MPFEVEPTRVPAAIGNITVTLNDFVAPDPYQSASYKVDVILSDGRIVKRSGDLVPHITPAQRQGLIDFMAVLRAQAENEILPP